MGNVLNVLRYERKMGEIYTYEIHANYTCVSQGEEAKDWVYKFIIRKRLRLRSRALAHF